VFGGVGPWEIALFLTAAAIKLAGTIPYYRALRRDDTTEVVLLSQISPIIALAMGAAFLHQIITPLQLVAFCLILFAAILVIVGSGHHRIKLKFRASIYVLIACFCWVVSDIIFVSQAVKIDFITSFFWMMLGGALVQFTMLIVFNNWRQDLGKLLRRNRFKKLLAISANESVWLVGEIAWRLGIVVRPVAIMSVTASVLQLIATFVLGIILTLIWPRFGREKLNRKLVLYHLAAIVVMAVAITLIG